MENTPDVNVTSKKCGFNFIYIIIAVVILLVLAAVSYYLYVSKPINTYKKIVNRSYANISNELKDIEEFNVFNHKLSMNYDIKLESDIEELKDYVGDTYSLGSNIDIKNQYVDLSLKAANKKTSVAGKLVLDNDKLFVAAPDYLDNPLLVKDEVFDWDLINDYNINTEDLDTILKLTKDELIKALDKENFEKEKDTIEINGKDAKVTKITYALSGKEANKTFETIIDNLKDNDDFIEAIENLTNIDSKDIEDALDTAIENFDIEGNKLEFNVYVKGFTKKVVQVEMKINDDSITYKNYKDKDIALICEVDGEKAELTITKEKDSYDLLFKCDDIKVTADISEYSDELIDFTFKVVSDDEVIASGSYRNELDTNKKDHISGEFEFSFCVNGNKDQKVTATIGYEMKADDIDKEDIESYDEIEDLTEDDIEKLKDVLDKDTKDLKIRNIITSLAVRGDDLDLGAISVNANPYVDEDDDDDDDDDDFDYDFSDIDYAGETD